MSGIFEWLFLNRFKRVGRIAFFFSYASANAYALKIAMRFLKTSNKLA
ncbi:hypothetical protein [Helicobacter pylori]|nr:hypothetical protein [Helicobacter pylori]